MSGAVALGAVCAGCGHRTSYHPSAEHATAYITQSNGRYAPECLGREGNPVNQFGPVACRCRATREEVSAAALPPDHAFDTAAEMKAANEALLRGGGVLP